MSACQTSVEQLCDCCTGTAQETPEFIGNRSALSSIAYRVGRYATFNASMLASLSESAFTPLGLLRTRDPADFSIALLDSWAVTLDILTFYQERFANEAFLRTAVDQRSVFELARLIGYVPSPGVSASTVLAFTLSSAPGSPDNVLISAGTRVQSVPGPGQTPQVFETSADITALINYNALPAQTTVPWQLAGGDTSTWIQGTANSINVGDVLLFVTAANGIPAGTGPGDVHYVIDVSIDSTGGNTMVSWDSALSSSFTAGMNATQVCIYVFRKKAALYGAQAPNAATLPNTVTSNLGGAPSSATSDWNYDQYVTGSGQVNLDASYPGLTPTSAAPQWAVLTGDGSISFFQITATAETNPNLYTLTTKTTQLTLAYGQVVVPSGTSDSLDSVLQYYTEQTRNVTAYVQSAQLTQANLPLLQWSNNPGYAYTLQSGMVAPVAGNTLTVTGGQQIAVGQPVGISGKRARIQVLTGSGASFTPAQSSTSLAVADNQIFLADAYPPTTDPSSGMPAWSVITLSGIAGTLLVANTSVQLLRAATNDALTGEAAAVNTTAIDGDLTTLSLVNALNRIYDATTVSVNANAVNATNGETMQEILGSGDATNSALQFALKQLPLTYVTAPTGNGTQSTLQVWVNNLRWQEVPNLLASGPADRAFVTRVNTSGYTVVQFGDGVDGTRTPTGQMNIRAVYRKGIGSAGMVAAGQLSQPLDRPQGLKSVTNPSAASGGADPATAAQAQASAPLPTMTLGRVVSLEDYQNFALNFGGIAKALASWTYFSGTRGVFLTVAGANGATFQQSDSTITNLTTALLSCGNPHVPLYIASYDPVLFQVTANVAIDQNTYNPTQVLAQIWQNLSAAYTFNNLLLAQGVAASAVIEIIQQTPGVTALQLQGLFLSGSPTTTVPAMLCAQGPMPPQGAQMLLLDPACQNAIGVWS